MKKSTNYVQELVRASGVLGSQESRSALIESLVDQAVDISGAESACFMATKNLLPSVAPMTIKNIYSRGNFSLPKSLPTKDPNILFIFECREYVLINQAEDAYFGSLILHPAWRSTIIAPMMGQNKVLGLLFLGSTDEGYFSGERLNFLDSYVKMSGGLLHNQELVAELREKLSAIEKLERYQDSIFTSMTNLLLTTDSNGDIAYFNLAAADRFQLTPEDQGKNLDKLLGKTLGTKLQKTIAKARDKGDQILGYQGIALTPSGEMDFSLNLSPLKGVRGANQGQILLFSDQSREKELMNKMESAVEERRVVKDMFSRYLSKEVVANLVKEPEKARLGGDKKNCTLFFADIRGYTSFSEGKTPEYIVEVLNGYFSQAVEVVIKHNGFIDKFIGDCIMAVWGVPMFTEEQDAKSAVQCALEIQELVKSKDRTFFTGQAKHLQVGFGMHSGPLVAGNLGSDQRMDYSVIGDTVNIAARLEGVSGAGEIIITENTRDLIGDRFKCKDRGSVKVKGKEKPLVIFEVVNMV
jgi:adenylate cyclase